MVFAPESREWVFDALGTKHALQSVEHSERTLRRRGGPYERKQRFQGLHLSLERRATVRYAGSVGSCQTWFEAPWFEGACKLKGRRPTQKNTHPNRGPITHPKSRNTKKNTAFTRTFSKSSRELFPASLWDESGRNWNCSEKLVQVNFFILGGFFRVDFPPVTK